MIKTDDQTINEFLKEVERYRTSEGRKELHEELDGTFYNWTKNISTFFNLVSNVEVFSEPSFMEKDRDVAAEVADTFNFAILAELVLTLNASNNDLAKFLKMLNVAYSASYIRIIADLSRNVEESAKRQAANRNN